MPAKMFDESRKVEFVNDFNSGLSDEDMSRKYGLSVATIKHRISSLRKEGYCIPKRKKVYRIEGDHVDILKKSKTARLMAMPLLPKNREL